MGHGVCCEVLECSQSRTFPVPRLSVCLSVETLLWFMEVVAMYLYSNISKDISYFLLLVCSLLPDSLCSSVFLPSVCLSNVYFPVCSYALFLRSVYLSISLLLVFLSGLSFCLSVSEVYTLVLFCLHLSVSPLNPLSWFMHLHVPKHLFRTRCASCAALPT